MTLRLLLAFLVTTTLAAQNADFAVHIEAGPFDDQQRATATVVLDTIQPMSDREELVLDVNTIGGIYVASWTATDTLSCVQRHESSLRCTATGDADARLLLRINTTSGSRTGFLTARLLWRERGFREEVRTFRKDLYRFTDEFVVTHGGDSGPGTLRQAILDANASCNHHENPCLIRFETDLVRPAAPLPVITAQYVTIDGNARATLDGADLQQPASGLVFAPVVNAQAAVHGLTIRNFPAHGIDIYNQAVRINSCVITGNGSRGIVVQRGSGAEITSNDVVANGRSGIFSDEGLLRVYRNRIEDNGASGIFIGRGHDAQIVGNAIAGNAEFGIASIRENSGADIGSNRITNNPFGAIDIGLDGSSFFLPDARGILPQPNGPVLLSATYDPVANETVVTGRMEFAELHSLFTYDLQFYATSGQTEADRYLGAIHITQPEFRVAFPGDLRGSFLTANTIRILNDEVTERRASELAHPIEVR